jgi:hypothetical protein
MLHCVAGFTYPSKEHSAFNLQRLRHYIPSKCQDQLTPLHSRTSQRIRILNINAVETSNLTYLHIPDNSSLKLSYYVSNISTKHQHLTQHCKIADNLYSEFSLKYLHTIK